VSTQAHASDESSLKLSYADTVLAEITRKRQVWLAAQAGMPQRDIARGAHMSQSTVHRVLKQAQITGTDESIEEIVLSRFVGVIDTPTMMERLAGYRRWVPRVIDPVDGILPGDSQAEVEALVDDGFLSDDEADAILDAHG